MKNCKSHLFALKVLLKSDYYYDISFQKIIFQLI